jgi:hypothetical protein
MALGKSETGKHMSGTEMSAKETPILAVRQTPKKERNKGHGKK